MLSTQEYLAKIGNTNGGIRGMMYGANSADNMMMMGGSSMEQTSLEANNPYEDELKRLRERVEKLEGAVKRTQTLYTTTINDIFNSVPAKASAMERGAEQYPFKQPSRIEICFGRRFAETPKIAVWISLRDPPATAATSQVHSANSVTSAAGGGGEFIENELGAELIKIKPSCITVNNRLAIVKLPQEVINAAATFERKQKAVLHWIAWSSNTVNPKLTALIQRLTSSVATGLSRQLKNEIQECIDTCGGVNGCDEIGQTLLHGAALTGNNELVSWLLHKGANIDCSDRQGWTPLLMAISERHPETAQLLLKKGASVNVTCERGVTCLHLLMRWPAYSDVQARLVQAFTTAGLDVNTQSDSGETPLLHLCRKRKECLPMAQYLLGIGANPTTPDLTGLAPLHVAAEANNLELVNLLLKYGAPLDAEGPAGIPAMVAMRSRSAAVIKILAAPLAVVPDAIYARIFRTLAPVDLYHTMAACRKFRSIGASIAADESYWQAVCGGTRETYTTYYALCNKMRADLIKCGQNLSTFVTRNGAAGTAVNGAGSGGNGAVAAAAPGPANVIPQGCVCPRLAIAVFGAPFSGKSNFISRFTSQKYGAYASLQMETVAAGQFKTFASGRVLVNLELAGNFFPTELILIEIPDPMTASVAASVQQLWDAFAGCIILADLTRKDCADHARQFVNVWYKRARDDMLQNIVVVGTKADVQHTAFVRNSASVMKFADGVHTLYTPSSAISGNGVDLAVKILCDKISASQTALKTAYSLLMVPELQSVVY